ncbi:MAG: permease-like cell division protein FtsX [Bacteriovorax sp.]|jgi:cell division transport system permease protein|nr:permease-like cell division protein FtsX [Bacteriovorax sp.]
MEKFHLRRIIRAGVVGFVRNGVISLASLLTVTITLSVLTSIVISRAALFNSLEQIKDKVDITVYFISGTPEEEITSLKTEIEKLPEVELVGYISAEEALDSFKLRHEDDYLTLQALEELDENPLGASINIKAKETSQYESISTYLESDKVLTTNGTSIIEKINYYQNKQVIERLNSIIDGAEKLGVILTLILVLISVAITYNTIRLAIYISREEIGIMRLVGADNLYIRGPFVVQGIMYGVISSVVTILIFVPITLWLGAKMSYFLGTDLFNYYTSNLFWIFLVNFFFGIILGILSSTLAVRKYLNK